MPGDLCIATSPALYKTVLGSCISVCLYDTRLRRGAMNHFMFSEAQTESEDNRYGNISMNNMIRGMIESGSSLRDLSASVYGGASGNSSAQDSPGSRNIKVAKNLLKNYGIPIDREITGGCFGRKLQFNTETNEVSVVDLDNCLRQCGMKKCDRAVGV